MCSSSSVVFVVFVVFVVEVLVVVLAETGADAGQAQTGQVEPGDAAAERAKLPLLQVGSGAAGVTHRGEHQVRHGRGGLRRIRRVDHTWIDGQVEQLASTADDRPDGTAPSRPGHLGVGQRLLSVHQLRLHLLRSLENLLHIKAARFHTQSLLLSRRCFPAHAFTAG